MAQESPPESAGKRPTHSLNESPAIRRASIEALDEAIVRLAARMDAACYEQLVLIREFDERLDWVEWQLGNCSEWLAWRCDISLNTAREKVRVAHALLHLPNIAQAFAEGRLSYTKVRALTRVTHLRHESELLRFALKHTAMQVEERCRELRCGTVASTEDANRSHERRYCSLRRNVARGSVVLTLEVPLEEGEILERALAVAREGLVRDDGGSTATAGESWSALQADALMAMARTYLDGGDTREQGPMPPHHLITVHIDRSALAEGRGRSGLPVETVRRLACDAQAVTLLLCTRHHRAVHEGGFTIRKDYLDAWRFFRPDGVGVPACGYVVRFAEDGNAIEMAQPGLKLARLIRAATLHASAGGFAPPWKEPAVEEQMAGKPARLSSG